MSGSIPGKQPTSGWGSNSNAAWSTAANAAAATDKGHTDLNTNTAAQQLENGTRCSLSELQNSLVHSQLRHCMHAGGPSRSACTRRFGRP